MFYSRWWADRRSDNDSDGLSILELVNSGEIDCKLAGLLWLLMERRASVLVAAGPVFAGKTTLLHALLDFLPPELQQISLQGYYEDFQFMDHARADKSYLVAEEISNHGYSEYLWGLQAVKVFDLLSQGYALGATIHARNSKEAVYVLNRGLGIPLDQLSQLGIIVNLRAVVGPGYEDEPIRRISAVDLVRLVPEGLSIQTLATLQDTGKGFIYLDEKSMQEVLTGKRLIGKHRVGREIETRKRFLTQLLEEGRTSRQEIKNAIQEYYRSNPV